MIIKTIVFDYLRLTLFSVGLLLGLQIPALVDQYQKRVDAHLTEARQNLAGFQSTADRYFDGSVEKLVVHYTQSDDPIFRQDANNIRAIYDNVKRYQAEMDSLLQGDIVAVMHVLFNAEPRLMEETLNQYTYAVVLSPQALVWGLILAFVFAVIVESLLRGLFHLTTRKRTAQ